MSDETGGPLPLWRVLEDEYRELHATGTAATWNETWEAELARITKDSPDTQPTPAELEATLHQMVHRLSESEARTALCLSGGGIRSASFGLGVLQGLARRNLLSK